MEKFKLYKVGGCVRDTLLGLKSKDIDYSFIFEEIDTTITPDEYFIKMKNNPRLSIIWMAMSEIPTAPSAASA